MGVERYRGHVRLGIDWNVHLTSKHRFFREAGKVLSVRRAAVAFWNNLVFQEDSSRVRELCLMIAERIVRKSGLWNSSEVRNSFINENTAWLVENIRRAILALSIVFAVLLVNFTAIARFRDQKHIRCHRFSIVDQFSVNFWTLLSIRSRILRFYLLLKSFFPVCFTSKSIWKSVATFSGTYMSKLPYDRDWIQSHTPIIRRLWALDWLGDLAQSTSESDPNGIIGTVWESAAIFAPSM